MGGWLHEALPHLFTAWPKRCDDVVPVAALIHRVTPDATLPNGASPYSIPFRRDLSSHMDTVTRALDGNAFSAMDSSRPSSISRA